MKNDFSELIAALLNRMLDDLIVVGIVVLLALAGISVAAVLFLNGVGGGGYP